MTSPDGYGVNPIGLRDYSRYLDELADSVTVLSDVVRDEAMNTEGFIGVLDWVGLDRVCVRLRDDAVLPAIHDLYLRLSYTAYQVLQTAKTYGLTEEQAEAGLHESARSKGRRDRSDHPSAGGSW